MMNSEDEAGRGSDPTGDLPGFKAHDPAPLADPAGNGRCACGSDKRFMTCHGGR